MHSSRQKEDISISYISALCADAGILYDIQRRADFSEMPKSDNKQTVTVAIPKEHVINEEFLLDILERIAKEA